MSRSGGNFRDGMGNSQRSVPRSAPVLNTKGGPAPSTRGFLSSSGVSDAHFARKQREAEDIRHARMLQSIIHRPYRASVGAFTNAKDHAFYSRTLAMRMKNARLYKEFRRQKDNLLLLQRLQQIHFYEHPSRTKVGKNYSKEWQQHQEKHDAARRRLTARPRMGNSLIFAKGNRESPLSPRNRINWEGKRDHSYQDTTIYRDVNDPTSAVREKVGRAIGTSSSGHNNGMIFSRGRPGNKPTSPSHHHQNPNAPDDRSSLAEKLAYERHRIEQELQKRWQAFGGEDHPDAYNPDESDEALGGETDDIYDEPDPALLEWERDLELPPEDVEDEGLSQFLKFNRSRGYEGPNLPHPILQDYSNYNLSSSPIGVPSQSQQPPSYLPLSSNASQTASGPLPPPPDTSRRQAMRARYIDEDESEVSELDEDDNGADDGEQASGIASSTLTSSHSRPSSASISQQHHRRHHSKRSSTGSSGDASISGGGGVGNSRLYNLAMHSGLDEGDRELQAYRLHQWEVSLPPELRASISRQQQQPHAHPPLHPQPPSARSRPGSAQPSYQQPVSARGSSSRPQSASSRDQSASSPRQSAATSGILSQRSPRPTSASSRETNELDDVLATLSAWDRDHESQSTAEALRIEALARQRNRDRELMSHNTRATIDEGDERSSVYANEDEEADIRRARMKRGIYQQQQQQQQTRPRVSSAAANSRGSSKRAAEDLSHDADRYFQQLKEEFPSSRRPASEADDPPPSFLQDTFTTRVTSAQSKAQIAANRSRSKPSRNRLEPAVRPR